ncbi:GNAT family N-acetyltransferase [Bacillus manliponensis]|uniref:GNAT family N-acetyltransferase n=1 Tax=Bacillus manliponensis TaxID=574376 RepID=UPI003517BE0D
MHVRQLDKRHIPNMLGLNESVGWLQHPSFTEEQYKMFLSIGKLFGHFHENDLISSIALFPYEKGFTSIGMLIVHPKFQKKGLGTALLNSFLNETPPFLLVATDMGAPLYEKHGFHTVTFIHRLERKKSTTINSFFSIKDITSYDLPTLVEMDYIASGAHRSHLYKTLLDQAHFAFKIERRDRVEAFAFCFIKGDTLCVTPLIAKYEEDALHLVLSICEKWSGTVRVDVPASQTNFLHQLHTYEFQETLRSPLMMKGSVQLPGNRKFLFAMMDAALC